MFISMSADNETDFREFKHPASVYPPRKYIEEGEFEKGCWWERKYLSYGNKR